MPVQYRNANTNTQLSGRRLFVARLSWWVLVLLAVVLWVFGTIELLEGAPTSCVDIACDPFEFTAEDLKVADEIGFPFGLLSVPSQLANIVMPLIYFAVAAVIYWRRSDDWIALIVSFTLVFTGGAFFTNSDDAFRRAFTDLIWLQNIVFIAGVAALLVLFFVFPDGRVIPTWTRYFLPLLLLNSFFFSSDYRIRFFWGWIFALGVLLGLYAQVYRYRHVATPQQRQQTKWVILGFASLLIVPIFWSFAGTNFAPDDPSPERLYYLIIVLPIATAFITFFPLSIAFSVFRYRLWDIDILINRALVYGTLTAAMATLYFGFVVVFQTFLRTVTGEQSPLVIVLSTLIIAALFTPLRRRLQQIIDRRFYRRKYDAAHTLAAFAEHLKSAPARDDTDLDELASELVRVVAETMQPESASVWFRRDKHGVVSKPERSPAIR